MLNIKNVQCQKAGEILFSPISVNINKSELILIKGPNGSGKTTFIEALAGLSSFASGEVLYQNQSQINEWIEDSHYLGHSLGSKANLNCIENLKFVTQINGLKISNSQFEEALAHSGLAGYACQFANDLSAGQKKRLALSRLLLLNKKFWLLDEPFVNLDQEGCDWLIEIIENHINSGGSIIMTTHENNKIEAMAHQIITLENDDEECDT